MSSVDSADRARCPILSCGTYLMLERTREGTRAGEGEGGQAGRYCCRLPARCFASAPGSEEAGPTQPQHPSPSRGCKTLQKHWASNLASVLARRPRPPGKLGSGAAESPAPWCPPFVYVSTLNASLLGLLALSRRVLHLLAVVSGCQAARASSGTARTTDDWSHLHC